MPDGQGNKATESGNVTPNQLTANESNTAAGRFLEIIRMKTRNNQNTDSQYSLFSVAPAPVVVAPIVPIVISHGPPALNDLTHWSKDERYDAEAFLEAPYKKHLGRHANK